jgi:hypothetical protein
MTREPGTGTQYYIEAHRDPPAIERIVEKLEAADSSLSYDEIWFNATQFRYEGRTWQCGGKYWDTEIAECYELQSIVRKSAWCDTGNASEGPLRFRFESAFGGDNAYIEVAPESMDTDMTDRFQPRRNLPYTLQ